MNKISKAQNDNGKYKKLLAVLLTFALYTSSALYIMHYVDDISSWLWDKLHTDITLPWKIVEFRIRVIAISAFMCFLIVCSYACILSPIKTGGKKAKHKIVMSPEEMR